jgi:hypothetical protein
MTTPTSSIHTTPRRVSRRAATAALCATALAVSLGACSDESAHPPRNDVGSDWSCATDGGVVRAGGTITNHSSKTSFYQLDIEFRVDGLVVDERGASVDGVEPGETTRVEVVSDDAHGDVTCHVADVSRFRA